VAFGLSGLGRPVFSEGPAFGHGDLPFELNISEIMVKAHRGQAMRKMKADSLADLVNMAAFHRGSMPGPPGARRGKLWFFIVSYHLLKQVAFLARLDFSKCQAHSAPLSVAEQTSLLLHA